MSRQVAKYAPRSDLKVAVSRLSVRTLLPARRTRALSKWGMTETNSSPWPKPRPANFKYASFAVQSTKKVSIDAPLTKARSSACRTANGIGSSGATASRSTPTGPRASAMAKQPCREAVDTHIVESDTTGAPLPDRWTSMPGYPTAARIAAVAKASLTLASATDAPISNSQAAGKVDLPPIWRRHRSGGSGGI